ncbi:MAG: hypothetical protein CMJ80_10045 [Planctomycetaceae bacterium]|nr:hypothetical protein [Planctomycetaceae bacterium]
MRMFQLKRIFWVAFVFVAVLTRASAEESPVDSVSRQFRILTYQQFRSNRTEFDRRIAAAEQVTAEWKQHGEPADRMAEIVDWFKVAQKSQRLPTKPNYRKTSKIPAHHDAIKQLDHEPPDKVVIQNQIQPTPQNVQQENTPKPIKQLDHEPPDKVVIQNQIQPAPKNAQQKNTPEPIKQLDHEPPDKVIIQNQIQPAPQNVQQKNIPEPIKQLDYKPPGKVVIQNQIQPAPKNVQQENTPVAPLKSNSTKPLLASDFTSPRIKDTEVRVTRKPVFSQRRRRSAPFSEIRTHEPEPSVSLAGPKQSFIEPPSDDGLFVQPPPIENTKPPFNLEVLTAKIRSLNLSLTQIESDLAVDREWPLVDLEATTKQLAKLLREYDLVMTYFNVTPPRFHSQMMVPLEPTTSVALLAQRLFELKIRLANDVSSNSDQLVRLNRVYDRMQQMSPPPRGRQP